MVKRNMRDKIKLALQTKGSITQQKLYDYILEKLDAEATIITVYLTLRAMVNEGIVLRVGDVYSYKITGGGLI
jgi:Fe2+ or Zn2+ uptake regulation protein